MWPGCNQCGAAVPALDDLYCGGRRCVNKGAAQKIAYGGKPLAFSTKADRAKKKQQRKNKQRGRR